MIGAPLPARPSGIQTTHGLRQDASAFKIGWCVPVQDTSCLAALHACIVSADEEKTRKAMHLQRRVFVTMPHRSATLQPGGPLHLSRCSQRQTGRVGGGGEGGGTGLRCRPRRASSSLAEVDGRWSLAAAAVRVIVWVARGWPVVGAEGPSSNARQKGLCRALLFGVVHECKNEKGAPAQRPRRKAWEGGEERDATPKRPKMRPANMKGAEGGAGGRVFEMTCGARGARRCGNGPLRTGPPKRRSVALCARAAAAVRTSKQPAQALLWGTKGA